MKKLLFLTGIFCALQANAQDYLINFKGTAPIKSFVKVDNLRSGESTL